MSEKTTGGVWVACSDRLPNHRDLGQEREVVVMHYNRELSIQFYDDVRENDLYWLDTTVEIITKAEHDAAIAKLHKEFGCELRDQNGTIWDQAARLQKENEELRASNEELRKRYDEARLLIKRCTDAFYRDGHEDSETIDDAMSAALDWISQEELEEEIFGDKCDDHEYLD